MGQTGQTDGQMDGRTPDRYIMLSAVDAASVIKCRLEALRYVFTRWRAHMILKPYPPAERPSLRLKVFAAAALIGRRAEWGYRRKWEGNYLFLVRRFDMKIVNN